MQHSSALGLALHPQLAFPEAALNAEKHCGYPGSRRIGIVQILTHVIPGLRNIACRFVARPGTQAE